MNHNSISEIRELLEREGIALKKRFGQNFLVDETARRRITGAIIAELGTADESSSGAGQAEVWEIGPGIGSLTDALLDAGIPLRLFEIDHGIIAILRERYGDRVPIEEGDFLRTVGPAFQRGGSPAMIVGNLPYSSASAIVARIIEAAIPVPRMVFLVQAELADRFRAAVGKKEYSALSVLVQNHYRTEVLFQIGGNAFYPRPEVGSSVIVMRELPERLTPELTGTVSLLARGAFSQRRKAIRNSLKEYRAVIDACGIDPGLRPERLSPGDFVTLARALTPDRTPS